jgi:hypothetical protein
MLGHAVKYRYRTLINCSCKARRCLVFFHAEPAGRHSAGVHPENAIFFFVEKFSLKGTVA